VKIGMGKQHLAAISRILMVDAGIVLLSAGIGIALNRSFVARPRESLVAYTEVGEELNSLSGRESKVSTQISGHALLSEVNRIVASKSMELLDGRSEKDYEAGHIPGAYSLSVAAFDTLFAALADRFPQSTPFLIYCGSGQCGLSRQLAERLQQKGYLRLKIYLGGYNEWFLAGNPVEKGKGLSFR